MMKPLRVNEFRWIGWVVPLLVAYMSICAAQAADCTATVKVAPVGVENPDVTQMKSRTLRLYRYRIDATSSEKQCAAIDFKIRRSYKLPDGSAFTAADPGSIKIHGGTGKDFGERAEKDGPPKIVWSAEEISCRRC